MDIAACFFRWQGVDEARTFLEEEQRRKADCARTGARTLASKAEPDGFMQDFTTIDRTSF
jgi:hypothetical protein